MTRGGGCKLAPRTPRRPGHLRRLYLLWLYLLWLYCPWLYLPWLYLLRWLPGPLNTVLLVGAVGLDIVLLAVLVPFVWFHFRMAFKNHTTVDGAAPRCPPPPSTAGGHFSAAARRCPLALLPPRPYPRPRAVQALYPLPRSLSISWQATDTPSTTWERMATSPPSSAESGGPGSYHSTVAGRTATACTGPLRTAGGWARPPLTLALTLTHGNLSP